MPNIYLVTTPNGASATIAETPEQAIEKVAKNQSIEKESCMCRAWTDVTPVE